MCVDSFTELIWAFTEKRLFTEKKRHLFGVLSFFLQSFFYVLSLLLTYPSFLTI